MRRAFRFFAWAWFFIGAFAMITAVAVTASGGDNGDRWARAAAWLAGACFFWLVSEREAT